MRLIILLVLVVPIVASAQPATDIHLFEVVNENGKMRLRNGRNITNQAGYDNQPFFHPSQPVLYFASADGEGRTDIVEYHLVKRTSKKFTQTHDREYSPTVTPDQKFISCILQTDVGKQYLVQYPLGGGKPDTLINDKIVGYHTWVDADRVVVFTLPQPFKLELVNVRTRSSQVITEAIGRSLHRVPGKNAISFIKKIDDDDFEIHSFDVLSQSTSVIAKSLPGKERDMTWTPDKKVLMSDENSLYVFEPGTSSSWEKVEIEGDFSSKTITRIAISPDGKTIALVISE